ESPLLNEILHTLAKAKLSPRHDGHVSTELCCWWEGVSVSSTFAACPIQSSFALDHQKGGLGVLGPGSDALSALL
ncbi:hypothetical protein GOODEAATRI_005896, partial [Goodea atripinnis]